MSIEQPKLSEESKNLEPKQETPPDAESLKLTENLSEFTEIPKGNQEKVESVKSQKEIEWDNKQKEIESWGDKQGLGIDEKVKDTVVAFNVVGLPTGESCEGHLDHGYSAPWVGVEAPDEPAERFIGQNNIFQKVANEYGLSLEEIKRGENNEAYFKALGEAAENGETPEYDKWRQKNQELMKKTSELLDEFYKDRNVPENLKLKISEGAEGPFRIHNGGEDYRPMTEEKFEKLADEQKKDLSQRLEQYQGEIKEFTEFLKEKYFGNSKEGEKNKENKEFILTAERVGNLYKNLSDFLIGKGNLDKKLIDEMPDMIKNKISGFAESIEKNKEIQHLQFSLKKMTGADLLMQKINLETQDEQLKSIAESNKYELAEPSSGIFVIYLNDEIFHDLIKAEAQARNFKDGISYIILPKKEEGTDYGEKLLRHETSHIAWSFLVKDKKAEVSEENDEMWNAYRTFQDETIAKLMGKGGAVGYSHLLLADKYGWKGYADEIPEKEAITRKITEMNDLLMDKIFFFLNDAGLKREDLILPLIQSENFEQLENNLNKFKASMDQRIEEKKRGKKEELSGWDTV